MNIRVVTDSTSDIPEDLAARHGIIVVPAYINVGNHSYVDGVDLTRQEFYANLPHYSSQPTTAAPSPGAFAEVYQKLADEGVAEILSIHVAGSLSGMLNAARSGADAVAGVEVSLFDSRQVSMGLGLLAISAAEHAIQGATMDEIVEVLERQVARTYVFALLDTLEYLRRSGRVSWAEFGIGTLLRIKPMIKVYVGEVIMLDKVRTSKRALEQMLQKISELGKLERAALLHIQGGDNLRAFSRQAQSLFPNSVVPPAVEVTPAIGAHVGHGGLGIACIVAES